MLELECVKNSVAANVRSRKYLQPLFEFELFTLEQMLKETEQEQSPDLATKTLQYAQGVLQKMDSTPRPR